MSGYNSATDAHINAELLLVAASAVDGGSESQLALIDGPPPASTDGFHSRTWIDKTVCLASAGAAGDSLVLRVNYPMGSSIFGSIVLGLSIPR